MDALALRGPATCGIRGALPCSVRGGSLTSDIFVAAKNAGPNRGRNPSEGSPCTALSSSSCASPSRATPINIWRSRVKGLGMCDNSKKNAKERGKNVDRLTGSGFGFASRGKNQLETGRGGAVRDVRASARIGGDSRDEEFDLNGDQIADDYYSILGITENATQEEIRKAYYGCMKVCHPDLSNNSPDSVAFCSFVNEVYEVLSDPEMRAVYDDIMGYSMRSINPFEDTRLERDQAFVDEFSCIGCKNCANTAENTFEIEELWGRARVFCQTGDSARKVQEAIDTCPVNCIHWVTAEQLSLLEDEMRRMERVNVAVMMASQRSRGADVFARATRRWEKRRLATLARARVKKMTQKKGMWDWSGPLWSSEDSGDEKSENDTSSSGQTASVADRARIAKTAAAARRWREYSRRGVDRRAIYAISAMATMADSSHDEDEDRDPRSGQKKEDALV